MSPDRPKLRTTYVDLSHTVEDGMAPYPGLPTPRIEPHLDHDASRSHYEDAEFFLGKVDMPTNVGTYIDAPFHRFRNAQDLAQIPLERLAGLPGFVIDARSSVDRELAATVPQGDLEGAAVLIRTGWSSRWGTDSYWEPGPYLSESLADQLAEAHVGLVGVDCSNIDDTTTRRRPVHSRLLGADVLVVEHLCNLEVLPSQGFRFFAPVVRITPGASFPVRAFAEVERRDR